MFPNVDKSQLLIPEPEDEYMDKLDDDEEVLWILVAPFFFSDWDFLYIFTLMFI